VLAPVTAPIPLRRSLWTFATGDWHYLPDNPLSKITGRTVTFRLGPGTVAEASFTIDASLEAAGNVEEEISDLWIAFNRQVVFRGRIGASQDTHDGTTHTVQFSAADYRALLGRRIIYDADTKTWTSTDQSQVAWNLINQTQGKSGGGLGIVRGSGSTTGVNISPAYEAGATVQETIDTQAATTNGYDWDVEPVTGSTQLRFNVYQPRGVDRGVVLYFPGRIEQFTRQVDPSAFANALRATGGQDASNVDLTPVAVTESGIGSDPAGRWDGQFADSDIKTAALLTSKANAALAQSQVVTPTWTVTLSPDTWGGPSDIWLGDPVTLSVKSGTRLNVLETLRVQELAVTLDDDSDAATVAITLGAPPPWLKWNYRAVDKRLKKLERR
jgi:hypothetical protein